MAPETIIKVWTTSHVTSSRLLAAQYVDVEHYQGNKMVGVTGFEPATSWSQTRRSTKLSYTPLAEALSRHWSACIHKTSNGVDWKATCRRGDRSTKLSYTP